MNQNLASFLLFLAAGLPLFLLTLLEKCVDLRSYRKLGMTDKIAKVWSLEILILVVAQVLNALAACLLITDFNFISALILLFFPPLPIWALIVLYLFEMKYLIYLIQNILEYVVILSDIFLLQKVVIFQLLN